MNKLREFLDGKIVRVQNTDCICAIRPYNNGRIFMQLLEADTGAPFARVTLDLSEVPVIEDMMIVKDYAENEGIYDALLDAGIIKPAERKVSVGFNFGLICFFNLTKDK